MSRYGISAWTPFGQEVIQEAQPTTIIKAVHLKGNPRNVGNQTNPPWKVTITLPEHNKENMSYFFTTKDMNVYDEVLDLGGYQGKTVVSVEVAPDGLSAVVTMDLPYNVIGTGTSAGDDVYLSVYGRRG
ncbi:hypothetical protein RA178_06330 [Shewanella oncorhynchi]|uniref:Uncharacterized protein n=1 Tax=Shewanella oncorhynchi TaxID=2726434 RepID=A0AA50Q4A5_9GAMM|nr:hypothetical protein [Shewanella oncorhynchi]WMB74229.1 hypothetical protein RA178_06330 [Shewanella oncorhynchi]